MSENESEISQETGNQKGKGDYEVGYGKPPLHTRFQPGQIANPNGRPKFTITQFIREALERADHEQAKKLADQLIKQASDGNGTAIKEIMARIDGPIETKVDVTSNGQQIGMSEDQVRSRLAEMKRELEERKKQG